MSRANVISSHSPWTLQLLSSRDTFEKGIVVIWHISIKIDVRLFRLFQNGATWRLCFSLQFSPCPVACLSTSVTWLGSYRTQQAPLILDPPLPLPRVLLSTKPSFCVSEHYLSLFSGMTYRTIEDLSPFRTESPSMLGAPFPIIVYF